jgi:hypothetical protein
MAAEACGTSVCTTAVYPRAVTASIRRQLKDINLQDKERREQALHRLKLPETMLVTSSGYKTMRDAAMIELQFPEPTKILSSSSSSNTTTNDNSTATTVFVQEIDVLRGKEVVQQNTKEIGSICMVVRRPG